MYVHCSDCLLRRQPIFRPFTEDELAFVSLLKAGQLEVGAHEPIIAPDGDGDSLYTLLSGWACRYRRLPSGKRQVLDFLLPGDLIGLHAPTPSIPHGVVAITPASLCVLDGDLFAEMPHRQPGLLRGVLELLLQERERADMHMLLLGRQRPTERLACLLLELRGRLLRRNMMDSERCTFPLTYELLADASGMSRSQLAHSLVELRELGWATVRQGSLHFHAPARMAEACGYISPSPGVARAIL